tara:strand:+ start:2435 stop:2620 length:186 start_codon:yes stop_codon:yes gene_type:complete
MPSFGTSAALKSNGHLNFGEGLVIGGAGKLADFAEATAEEGEEGEEEEEEEEEVVAGRSGS